MGIVISPVVLHIFPRKNFGEAGIKSLSLWALLSVMGNRDNFSGDLNRCLKPLTSTMSPSWQGRCAWDTDPDLYLIWPSPQPRGNPKGQDLRGGKSPPHFYHRRATGHGGHASLLVNTSRNPRDDVLTLEFLNHSIQTMTIKSNCFLSVSQFPHLEKNLK